MMIKTLILLVILFSASIGITQSFAAEPELFDSIPSILSLKQNEKFSERDHAKQKETVRGNMDALSQDKINVKLFGKDFKFNKDKINQRTSDYTWFGSNENRDNAVLIIDENGVFGTIETKDSTYVVYPTGDQMHEIHKIDYSTIPAEHGDTSDEMTATADLANLSTSDQEQISQLEEIYLGDFDYTNNPVIIDVYVVYTDAADAAWTATSMTSLATLGIEKANQSFDENKLPVQFNLVEVDRVDFVEFNIFRDLDDLEDPNQFSRTHAVAENENADVVVMIGDYGEDACGLASEILSSDTLSNFAIVNYDCILTHSFTHEVGHLQGAGHNIEVNANSEFSYGLGFFDTITKQRSVMSYNNAACDDTSTPWIVEVCERKSVWSDPFENWFGTGTPAGTDDANNAKVVFVTAPYIASLRGAEQTYDDVQPTGSTNIPTTTSTGSTLDITATFDEYIHPNSSPKITLSDGTTSTTDTMTRNTDTVFTHSHTLTTETGTVSVSFSDAQDLYGNPITPTPTSGNSFTINAPTPADTTPPVVTVPSDITQSTTDSNGMTVSFTVIATDNIDGTITPTCTPVSDSLFPIGTTTVTCTATDSSSNTGSDSFTVTINQNTIIPDTTPPVITPPLAITTEATDINTLLILNLPLVSDDSGETIIPTSNSPVNGFPLGNTIVTWSATDYASNTSTETQSVTIIDTILPVLTIPEDVITISTGVSTTVSIGTASAIDIFPVTITNNATTTYPVGITSVVWSATDSTGNTSTAIQTINIQDNNGLTFSGTMPLDIILEANGIQTPVIVGNIIIGSGIPLLVTNDDTTTYPVGDNIVTWTITLSQAVTIIDTTPPVITIPDDVLVIGPSIDIGVATATDIADPNPIITNNSTGIFSLGTTVVTWTATDSSGNSVSENQLVTMTSGESLYFEYNFDSNLEGWEYFGNSYPGLPGYTLSHTSYYGGSATIDGDSFTTANGMQKTFDTSRLSIGSSLYLSSDWRSISGCTCSATTNSNILIEDASTGERLFSYSLVSGGTLNTGLQSYTSPDLMPSIVGHDSITVKFYLADSWIYNWKQQNWFDNIILQTSTTLLSDAPKLNTILDMNLEINPYQEISDYIKHNGTSSIMDFINDKPYDERTEYKKAFNQIKRDFNSKFSE